MKIKTLLISSVLLPFLTASAAIIGGDTIVIDFTKAGQETSGNWNNIDDADWSADSGVGAVDSVLNADLIRFSDGASTGVGLSWDAIGAGAGSSIAGLDVTTDDGSASFTVSGAIPTTAQEDLSFHVNGVNQFVFSDLNDTLTYRIEFQSWTSTEGRDANDWVIQPGLAGETTLTIDPNNSPSVYTFDNVATDGSGNIFLRSLNEGGGSDNAHINALEMTAIPEPSTIALFGLAGLSVLLGLRRRR